MHKHVELYKQKSHYLQRFVFALSAAIAVAASQHILRHKRRQAVVQVLARQTFQIGGVDNFPLIPFLLATLFSPEHRNLL